MTLFNGFPQEIRTDTNAIKRDKWDMIARRVNQRVMIKFTGTALLYDTYESVDVICHISPTRNEEIGIIFDVSLFNYICAGSMLQRVDKIKRPWKGYNLQEMAEFIMNESFAVNVVSLKKIGYFVTGIDLLKA